MNPNPDPRFGYDRNVPALILPVFNAGAHYEYQRLWKRVLATRRQFHQAHVSCDKISNSYLDAPENEDLRKLLVNKRQLIRLLTTGDAALEAVAPVTHYNSGTEQLFVVEDALLNDVWKKLAQILHPDKPTGDTDLFHAAKQAYMHKDFVFLRELWFKLNNIQNWTWIQTHGKAYAVQELERVNISYERMRQSDGYAVYYNHVLKRFEECMYLARAYLNVRIKQADEEIESLQKVYDDSGAPEVDLSQMFRDDNLEEIQKPQS